MKITTYIWFIILLASHPSLTVSQQIENFVSNMLYDVFWCLPTSPSRNMTHCLNSPGFVEPVISFGFHLSNAVFGLSNMRLYALKYRVRHHKSLILHFRKFFWKGEILQQVSGSVWKFVHSWEPNYCFKSIPISMLKKYMFQEYRRRNAMWNVRLTTFSVIIHCLSNISEYVNTRPLARGDLILPVDQWISNLLARIGDLILVAKFHHLKILRN